MLKALLKTRFLSLYYSMFSSSKNKKKHSPVFIVLIGLLAVYVFACLFLMFGFLFYSLCEPLCAMGLSWLYFSLGGILALVLCFVGSVFAAQTQLYDAKDNELLLAMPIPSKYILASRLLTLLLLNYFYQLFVLVPLGAVYLFFNKPTAAFIITFIVAFLVLPVLVLALSCIIGWLIALITSKIRSKNLITIVMSIGFLLGYFYVYSKMQTYLTQIIANGEQLGQAVKKVLYPFYHFGIAIAEGNFLSLILFAAVAILPMIAVYFILNHSFIKIITAKKTGTRVKYVAKELKTSSPRLALLKKELKHFISNPMYILNASLGSVFTVIAAGFLIFSPSKVTVIFEQLPELKDFIAPAVCAALCGISTMNIISAPSISLEGRTLWIVKSLPVKYSDVLLAKADMHSVITLPPVILAAIVSSFTFDLSFIYIVYALVLPILTTLFCAMFGVVINLKFPKFDWISEVVAIKQGMSTMLAMFGTLAIIIAPVILYAVWGYKFISAQYYLAVCTVVLAAVCFGLYRYLKTGAQKEFAKLG